MSCGSTLVRCQPSTSGGMSGSSWRSMSSYSRQRAGAKSISKHGKRTSNGDGRHVSIELYKRPEFEIARPPLTGFAGRAERKRQEIETSARVHQEELRRLVLLLRTCAFYEINKLLIELHIGIGNQLDAGISRSLDNPVTLRALESQAVGWIAGSQQILQTAAGGIPIY